ncbi:MAG TPA: carbohydrate-binding family 9-like protein, partial [Kofleriaceae bacterium]|nr:carbohydrate-binding family 9-like protein [Kofleriaceae bacterium]
LIDQAWSTAVTSPELVTADGSPDPVGKATAKLAWDDNFLYLFVTIVDSDITSPFKNHDDTLWKADAIEIFIDADGNRAGYVEMQVNPHNATFDSWFAGPRGPAGDVSWTSDLKSAVKVRGTADGGDTDQGWDVEIAIPWAAAKGRAAQMPITIPPRIGDRWKLNVVRVDFKSGSDRVSATSWNRIGYGDWHALDRMLTVVFADPTGATVPAAETAVPPVPDTEAVEPSGTSSGSGASAATVIPLEMARGSASPSLGGGSGSGAGSGVR